MAEPVKSDEQPSQDLNSAITACFSLKTAAPPFPERLLQLSLALTNARVASIWESVDDDWSVLAHSKGERDFDAVKHILSEASEEFGNERVYVRFLDGYLLAKVAVPSGAQAILAVQQPAGNAAIQGLTYERVSLLAHISMAQFRHSELQGQQALTKGILALAGGDTDRLQDVVDRLSFLTGSDFAAAALYDGTQITNLAVSGQEGMTKRADLPKRLRAELKQIAELRLTEQERYFAKVQDQERGLVLLAPDMKRPSGLLPMAGAMFALANHRKPKSKWTARRFAKLGAAVLVMVGLAVIPIPDGVDLPARIEASNKRIVTAPFTGVISDVSVTENRQVAVGDLLIQMDTREIELELIGVISERANAVIDRETARASRNAAELRNAELEVDRLQSQIDLLETRKESGSIRSTIAGTALLRDLQERRGTTVRQGEELMQVADTDVLHLELTVLEDNIARIAKGDSGTFRPDFDPSRSEAAEIIFISPALDLQRDPPQLVANAAFADEPEGLGPGLSGVFIIGDTYRPAWQVLYTNLRDWLLLRFLL